jgi:hypothetical protein
MVWDYARGYIDFSPTVASNANLVELVEQWENRGIESSPAAYVNSEVSCQHWTRSYQKARNQWEQSKPQQEGLRESGYLRQGQDSRASTKLGQVQYRQVSSSTTTTNGGWMSFSGFEPHILHYGAKASREEIRGIIINQTAQPCSRPSHKGNSSHLKPKSSRSIWRLEKLTLGQAQYRQVKPKRHRATQGAAR